MHGSQMYGMISFIGKFINFEFGFLHVFNQQLDNLLQA